MQQAMDLQANKSLHINHKQSTTMDRGHKHPRNKAGKKTNQNGKKPIGQVLNGMKVASPHTSSNHRPQTAAIYHGAKRKHIS